MKEEVYISRDKLLLQKLHDIVLNNLENEHFGVEQLAKAYGISRYQLHRRLKKIENKSISQFIREIRLEQALKLLQNESGNVSEVAYRVGFNSPTYFNTCFRNYFGYPPGKTRARMKQFENKWSSSKLIESIKSRLLPSQRPRIPYAISTALVILLIGVYYFVPAANVITTFN